MVRVHLLGCETRNATPTGSSVRDLQLRTAFIVQRRDPDMIIALGQCTGLRWRGLASWTVQKAMSIAGYARRIPAHDLVLFSDSDVIFVSPLSAAEVEHRFDEARVGQDILFQAEPFCTQHVHLLWGGTTSRYFAVMVASHIRM